MESIANILAGTTERRSSRASISQETTRLTNDEDPKPLDTVVYSNDPDVAALGAPEPVPCEFCGAPRYTKGMRLQGRIFWMPYGPEPCTCPEAVKEQEAKKAAAEEAERQRQQAEADRRMQERVKKIIGESGINARFLRRTFDTFEITKDNAKAAKVAKAYADNFNMKLPGPNNPEPGRNGLFITGPKGTGKTHLAAAIANQLMNQGTAVICMTMIDLLERIKRTYEKNADSESTVLTLYKQVPLLIIDDMGKEPATEWGISKIYAIINGRYEGYMPTIVTTNYDDQQLVKRLTPPGGDDITADATIDRLREMCHALPMTGQSWRSR